MKNVLNDLSCQASKLSPADKSLGFTLSLSKYLLNPQIALHSPRGWGWGWLCSAQSCRLQEGPWLVAESGEASLGPEETGDEALGPEAARWVGGGSAGPRPFLHQPPKEGRGRASSVGLRALVL